MNTNERLMKLATASPAVLAKVDAVLNGRAADRSADKDCRLVTLAEAAKMLQISRPTLGRLIKSGRISSVTLGVSPRVPIAAIHDFVNTPKKG